MKKPLLLVTLMGILSCWLAAQNRTAQPLVIAQDQVYDKDITSIKGTVRIIGKVAASVLMVGGDLQLSGEVGGDVICLGTRVEISDTAVIKGDLIVFSGDLRKSPSCQISGEFFWIRSRQDLKKVAQTLLPFLPSSGGRSFFKIVKIVFWLILTVLMLALFPAKVTQAEEHLRRQPLKIGLIGLLAAILFIIAFLMAMILSLIIIGIPFLLFLGLAYFAAVVFGRTVMFYGIGRGIAAGLKFRHLNPTFFILFGVVLYGLCKFIPWLGTTLLVVMDIFVIGIGVGFFFRKKLLS